MTGIDQVRIVEDREALAHAAAALVVGTATDAVAANGVCHIALAGGSTPRRAYELLADDAGLAARMPWAKTHFFFGDERCVPADHPDSNYRMAADAMLDRVPVPPENVHRIPCDGPDPEAAAARYEETIRQVFRIGPGALPRFDLVLLGLGPDGHTASLFPHTPALRETVRLAVANVMDQPVGPRVTLTAPVINNAVRVVFFVTGADKARILDEVVNGPNEPERLPAQLVAPHTGRALWLVDRDAAACLGQGRAETSVDSRQRRKREPR